MPRPCGSAPRPWTALSLALGAALLAPGCPHPAPEPAAPQAEPREAQPPQATEVAEEAPEEPLLPPSTPYAPGTLAACPSTDLGAPAPATIAGCSSAHCVRGARGLSVCRCLLEESDPPTSWIRASRGARVLAQLDVQYDESSSESFVAALSDLDGDSRQELVFGGVVSFLNGPGADFWRLGIVDDLEGGRPRLVRLDSAAFGPAAFVQVAGERRCALLVTGLHDAGFQDFRLYGSPVLYDRSGLLAPAASLPIVAVPHAEVATARFGVDGDRPEPRTGPLSWLDVAGALVLEADPALLGRSLGSREVGLGEVRESDSQGAVELRLDGAEGQQERALLFDPDVQEGDPLNLVLGDLASGRLFPSGYRSAALTTSLAGRRARLDTLEPSGGGQLNVLWPE